MDRKQVGLWGEDEACRYLLDLGYDIVLRNFHCTWGEIDIIANDGEYIVFVEVKTRQSRSFASPCEFVDIKKQRKIIKSAICYMQIYNKSSAVRFDVVEVLYKAKNGIFETTELNHIKNAFWEE
ncbi:MAG: YraN family protein [Clostridia bacterium]|nr:YraN family protein [Clostridia bacterium]